MTGVVAVGVLKWSSMRILFALSVLALGWIVFPTPSAFGVVVGSTDTSEFDEVTSPWFGMNWDYVYSTGGGTSVAIDSWHLISASHYSLGVGTTFTAGGDTFEITNYEVPPVDTGETVPPDMKIIEVQNITNPGIPLPGHYELYDDLFTIGQDTIIVGAGYTGTDHGTYYDYDTNSAYVKRWGTNEVERFRLGPNTTGRKVVDSGDPDTDPNWSTMTFRMEYTSSAMEHEAGLAEGDSGGGVFVMDGGVWKLGGIALYVTAVTGGYDDNHMASIPDYIDWIRGMLPEFLLGDANRDGVVSAADYSAVQTYFGNVGGEGLFGDANGDGVVSASDYSCIQANFGNTAPASSEDGVPEPATFLVLVIGGLGLLRRRGI